MNKIEIGFFNMYLKNDNIIKIIEDIILLIVEYVNLKNINVVFDMEIEEKIIVFDVEKIERIMLNLLLNVIKFIDYGGKINIIVYDKNNYILILVKDIGIGIF